MVLSMGEYVLYVIIAVIDFIINNTYIQFLLSFLSALLALHIASIILLKVKPDFKYKNYITKKGTTDLLDTQGDGASSDWTKWTHWQVRLYWSSETQSEGLEYGNVFTGALFEKTSSIPRPVFPLRPRQSLGCQSEL